MKNEMTSVVKEDRRKAKRRTNFLKAHDVEITRVTTELLGIPGYSSLRMDWQCCLDLNYTGDIEVLKALFHTFRTLGYEPNARPEDPNAPTFCTHFRNPNHPEIRWWLNFSSTMCKRVKVGTEMVERDVYEIKCVKDIPERRMLEIVT